ncbi:MAG: alpha/beta hydrolase fold domain-containing protein [Candidatus Helarchaeota archaeon]
MTGGIFGGQPFETNFAMLMPQLSGFTIIYLLISTILSLFLLRKRSWIFYTVFVLGTILIISNGLPLIYSQFATKRYEDEFVQELGTNYMAKIPENLKSQFRKQQFSLWNYYYGFHKFECNMTLDIPYLTVNGDTFKFDLYRPLTGTGPFPVIIAIHGGGWRSGDKGVANMFQFNRYFANQGYVVCDIQYGLAPDGYNMSDIVNQIGYFTKFLENHTSDYNINLSCTFFLGRSAGAQLSLVCGLGYKNSLFQNVFASSMRVAGIIEFYGPTNMNNTYKLFERRNELDTFIFIMNGTPTSNPQNYYKYSPINLVNGTSPPIIVLHGMNDQLVYISESEDLDRKCEDLATTCIILRFPFGGHGFDYLFQGQYCQIATYYIERFIGYFANQ